MAGKSVLPSGTTPSMQQLTKGDRGMFMASDPAPSTQQLIKSDRDQGMYMGSDPTPSMQQLIRSDRDRGMFMGSDPTPSMQQLIRSDRDRGMFMGSDPTPSMQQLIKSDRDQGMFMASEDRSFLPRGTAPSTQQLIRSDRSMFMASDDNVMLRHIQSTHHPDGREIDVKPILQLVDDILSRATMTVDTIVPGFRGRAQYSEDKAQQANFTSMLDLLAHTIDRLSSEIAYKCHEDGHQTVASLLNMVANYSWDAKLVLTLAAFALNYGEFWLLAQLYSSNQLAKSMGILRHVPLVMEQSGPLKPKFDALIHLTMAMLDLAWCIVRLNELRSVEGALDVPEFAAALGTIPIAVYWTMRGVVACAAQISSLTTMTHEYGAPNMEAWELSALAHKIKSIYDYLMKQLSHWNDVLDERRIRDLTKLLERLFYEMIHIDNMKVLKALIYGKDDQPPLFDGSSKRRVHLEVLRRKNVLLLITSLDISPEELSILEQIYNESRQHATPLDNAYNPYEVVWVPIVDRSVEQWTNEKQQKFESLQSGMPWYSVHDPSLIDRAVIMFVKEKWHFRNKPILVVLDPQGRVLSHNAIHMMWIWGSVAFPFTNAREEALWKEETWRLELLVNGIDQTVLNWIKEEKYIFVYGGDDIDWIRAFTREARSVAQSARIQLEMVYVGKSKQKERVRKTIAAVTNEKLSYAWQELMIWFFWTRLESMLHSKIQLGRADDHDAVMQEIKKLLSYDKSGSWAVLCRGSEAVVNGQGTKVMTTVQDYEPSWKSRVPSMGFVPAFQEYYNKLHETERPCCRFDFPTMAGMGRIPDGLKCPECHRAMEKYVSFLCCHD